jgi:hypothetical protein
MSDTPIEQKAQRIAEDCHKTVKLLEEGGILPNLQNLLRGCESLISEFLVDRNADAERIRELETRVDTLRILWIYGEEGYKEDT